MIKKLFLLIATAILWIGAMLLPTISTATDSNWWFNNQESSNIGVAWGNTGKTWSTWLIVFVQKGVNWVLKFLALITIIILIWGGFQMVTDAWSGEKYKKWFTIVKQTVIWLIVIWASALIVNLVFNFMTSNTQWTGWSWWWGTTMVVSQSKLA